MATTIKNIVIRIGASTKGLQGQMMRTERALKQTAHAADRLTASSRRAARALDEIGDQARGADRHLRRVGKGMASISGSAVKVSLMAGGLSVLAAGAASSIGPVMGLVSALAPIGGIAAAMPAGILGAVAAIASLKLAVSGMGDAFGAAFSGDAKKFKEALENLSPAARTFAREFKSVVPLLKSIRASAQNAFFAPLIGQLKQTVRVLVGPLRQGVALVAREFGSAGRDALEFARQARSVATIKAVFNATAEAINRLRVAQDPILKGFREMARAGSVVLPMLGQEAARVGTAFGEWLQRMADPKRITELVSNAILVFRQLGAIIKNVGSIISSVLKAAQAEGGGVLATIQKMTGEAAKFLKSAEGMQTMRSIFSGLAAIGQALAPVFKAIVTGLGTIAPAIGRIAAVVGPILTTAINAIAPALAALEPGITAVIQGLGAAVSAIGPALVPIGQAISAIMIAAAPLIPWLADLIVPAILSLIPIAQALVPPLIQIAQTLGTALVQAVTMLAPVLVPLATALAGILVAVAPIVPLIAQLLTRALLTLIPIVVALIPPIMQVAMAVGNALMEALIALAPHLPALTKSIGDLLIALIPLLPPITQLLISFMPLIPVVAQVLTLVAELATAVMPLLTFAIMSNVHWMKLVVGFIQWGFGIIYSVVSWTVGAVVGAFKWLYNVLVGNSIVPDLVMGILRWIGMLPGKIWGYFKDAGKWLYNAGRNILIGLWNGIRSMGNWIAGAIGRLVRAIIPGPVRRVLGIASPSKLFAGFGKNLGQGLVLGMNATQGMVAHAAGRLAGAAVPAMPGAPGLAVAPAGATAAGGGAAAMPTARDIADALVAAMRREGVGAVYLDGELLTKATSRRSGRQADQRRRTG